MKHRQIFVVFQVTIILVVCLVQSAWASSAEEVEQILNSTFSSYDKNIRPHFTRGPVHVGVTVHILSVTKIDTANQEFTVDLYFRQTWSDPRLIFQPRPGVSNVTLETDYLRRVWVPDTFFVNEVTSSFHTSTVSNELIRLKANGEVTKSMRLTITAICPMKLRDFPFDHPVCSLHIQSFSSSVKEIEYEWIGRPSSITIAHEAAIGDFTVVGYRLDSTEIESLPPVVGKYSRLTVDLQLKRYSSRYHTEYFSPCFLLTFVSLMGLWSRNPKFSISISIAVLIALHFLTTVQELKTELPKWAEHSWMDSYLRFCITFVMLSIIVCLLEINVPDYEEPVHDEEDDEIHLKVEAKKEARSSSTASEDIKLVRKRTVSSDSENHTHPPPEEHTLEEIKTKILQSVERIHRYYCIAEPYVKWILLFLLILSNWIFWKFVPGLHPVRNLVHFR